VANAYVWCTSGKRDVLVRDLKEMPVPSPAATDWEPLRRAAQEYLDVARATAPLSGRVERENAPARKQLELIPTGAEDQAPQERGERLRVLHWRMDAEVLKLYGLPGALERKVLDLFKGVTRRGVPFLQDEYMPAAVPELERLQDLLAITVDWPKTRERRGALIDLDVDDAATPAEHEELERLERLASAWIRLTAPTVRSELDVAFEELRRRVT
jgi:hypothetical protein